MAIGMAALRDAISRDMRAKVEDGDFYGEDGLLRCGKCGTPKECLVPTHGTGELGYRSDAWGDGNRMVVRPIQCKCVREEREAEERNLLFASRASVKARNKRMCFDIDGCSEYTFEMDDRADSVATEEARAFVMSFQDRAKSGSGLIFMGGVGCGKTFYAACVANELLDQGKRVKFTSLNILSQKMTEDYRNNFSKVINDIKGYDLVVLDDLGTERDTPTSMECCYQIVNALYQKKVPMLFTTNMTRDALKSPGDVERERIYSRIIQRCRPVVMSGRDRRKSSAMSANG